MPVGIRESPTRRSLIAAVAAAIVAVSGCSAQTPAAEASAPAAIAPDFIPSATTPASIEPARSTANPPDLRRMTVVVRAKPPDVLAAKYRELAGRYKELEKLFLALVEGGFGSGFVMLPRNGERALPLVVTNLHVLGLANGATASFEGSRETFELTLLYVDPTYDLAVLRFAAGAPPIARGLELELSAARDQQPVVASGYPGIDGEPSYQVTRGYVSNERFRLTEDGHEQIYVQHTAPIDPGSSGGPLTTEQGKLLGVNTLKVRRRENVGLAIPSSVVADAVGRTAREPVESSPPSPETSRASCEELAASVSRGGAGLVAAERAIGAAMIARDGFSSLEKLPRDEQDWSLRFVEDPTAVFVYAIALRLMSTGRAEQAKAPEGVCMPLAGGSKAGAASYRVKLAGGERTWTFAWEQRRWKLVEGSLAAKGGGEAFLRGIGAKGAKRKWKPSLR